MLVRLLKPIACYSHALRCILPIALVPHEPRWLPPPRSGDSQNRVIVAVTVTVDGCSTLTCIASSSWVMVHARLVSRTPQGNHPQIDKLNAPVRPSRLMKPAAGTTQGVYVFLFLLGRRLGLLHKIHTKINKVVLQLSACRSASQSLPACSRIFRHTNQHPGITNSRPQNTYPCTHFAHLPQSPAPTLCPGRL